MRDKSEQKYSRRRRNKISRSFISNWIIYKLQEREREEEEGDVRGVAAETIWDVPGQRGM